MTGRERWAAASGAILLGALLCAAPLHAGLAQQPAAPPAVATTTAADSVLEARVRDVAAQLRCPVCQGLSLQDSPSELSQEMRSLVREQLRAGKSPEEVKAYFVARYGEWILLAPPAHGFNLVVYGLPLVLLLGGGVVVAIAIRRWTRRAEASAPVESSPTLE